MQLFSFKPATPIGKLALLTISFLVFTLSLQKLNAQVLLPWSEGFENINDTTFQTNQSPVPGMANNVLWEYYTSSPELGRMRTVAGSSYSHSGQRAITMDTDTLLGMHMVTNYLTATIDLSLAAGATDLELSFWYMHHGEEAHANDRVWIRGDTGAAWIEVYDFTTASINPGIYTFVSGIDIDRHLLGASPTQSVSSTFQIRFGQQDNLSSYTLTLIDGITIDDINITGTTTVTGTDMSIEAITSPPLTYCSGVNDISVLLKNNGSTTIYSASIGWDLNGVAQPVYTPPYFFLPAGDTISFTIGNFTATAGNSYELSTYLTDINFSPTDVIAHNDTLRRKSKSIGMSGAYTIDSSGTGPTNYPSFETAVKDLIARGVCGPVTFAIAADAYYSTIVIPYINGSSDVNTITFDGIHSDSVILHSVSPNYPIIKLRGAQHFIFKNLGLANQYKGLVMTEKCKDIVIDSCSINIPYNQNNTYGIVATSSPSHFPLKGNNATDIRITNSTFTGGAGAISLDGYDSTTYINTGVLIENNTFHHPHGNAISIRYFDSVSVINNHIVGDSLSTGIYAHYIGDITIRDNRVKTGYRGLNLFQVKDFNISSNIIQANGKGVEITAFIVNPPVPVKQRKFINNMVSSLEMSAAVHLINQLDLDIYHNTCYGNPALYYQTHNTGKNNMVNNILVARNDVALKVDHYLNVWDSLNYNIYYNGHSSASDLLQFGSNTYADLASWRVAVPTLPQLQSLEGDPMLFAIDSLHARGQLAKDAGASWPGVTTDIDGDLRPSGTGVDIGADEYDAPLNDLTLLQILTKEIASCGDSAQPIRAVVRNNGSNTQSNVNLTAQLSGGSSQVLTGTMNGPLLPGQLDTVNFASTLDLRNGGKYELMVYHQLSSDNYQKDDTIRTRFKVNKQVELESYERLICAGDAITLPVKSNTPIVGAWYKTNNPNDTIVLSTGDLKLPMLFTDTSFWVTESKFGSNGVRIVEIDKGQEGFEIQNLGGKSVDLTGWTVAVNGSRSNINSVNPITKTLTGTLLSGGILHFQDFDPSNATTYWGGDIYWTFGDWPYGTGWVLLIDDKGEVVDFLPWVWTEAQIEKMNVTINGFSIRIYPSDWHGKGAGVYNNEMVLVRNNQDNNNADDWVAASSSSLGFQNTGVVLPTPNIGNSKCEVGRVPIKVSIAPTPDPQFTFDVNKQEVTFTNTTVENPDYGPYTYFWEFGDGGTSTQKDPVHTYPLGNKWQVSLKATNICEHHTTAQEVITPSATGLSEHESRSSIRLFPNPTAGTFMLENIPAQATINISDVTGKVLASWYFETPNQTEELNIAHLANGMYYLHISSGDVVYNKQLIKK